MGEQRSNRTRSRRQPSVLPSAPATVAALVARLLMTVGELDWSDVAVLAERLRKRSRTRRAAPVPRL